MNLVQKLFVLTFFLFATLACGGGEDTEEEQEDATEEIEEASEEEVEEEEQAENNSEEAQMLTKTWRMTSFTHEDKETQEALEEDILMLEANGTYSDRIEGKEQESGTWKLSEDQKQIIFKVETGEFMGSTRKVTIKELTEDKLVLSEGKITENFVPSVAEETE